MRAWCVCSGRRQVRQGTLSRVRAPLLACSVRSPPRVRERTQTASISFWCLGLVYLLRRLTAYVGVGVGYMPQEIALWKDLTIAETLRHYAEINHLNTCANSVPPIELQLTYPHASSPFLLLPLLCLLDK